ncbi:MAG: tetratricopeptide repeat protein [Chloroflexi bacterium]|nr:tetratricopeptide repeat protein [Chloroflexota bacterium]MCC6893746.1 tetratricopeptide repeat protein [Anaerolineae bacterium]
MYLKTPKRYAKSKQRRSPLSLRWLWLWILTPIVVVVGSQVYQRRAEFAPPVQQAINNVIESVQSGVSTVVAPTATATENPTAKLNLAENDWREGRIESAVNSYLAIAAALPNDATVHNRLAFGLIMQGRDDEALTAAENAVTADPFSSDAWAIRALALDRNDRAGEAVSSSLRALELDANSARALAFLALAYYTEGEYDLALSTSQRALEVDPSSYEALNVRGVIAQSFEFDREAARDYYQQAYDIAPRVPYVAVDLANILYTLGVNSGDEATMNSNMDDAISILSDVIEVNPNNGLALFALGTLYFRGQGNFSQAAEMLSRCVDANPNSIDCNAYLGRVQSSMDDNQSAIEHLQKAVDLGSEFAYYHFWLGRSQRALGLCSQALPNLRHGRELAVTDDIPDVVAAADELIRECEASLGIISATPIPEATAEATPE